jgi:hypothetical protein
MGREKTFTQRAGGENHRLVEGKGGGYGSLQRQGSRRAMQALRRSCVRASPAIARSPWRRRRRRIGRGRRRLRKMKKRRRREEDDDEEEGRKKKKKKKIRPWNSNSNRLP